MAAPKPAKPLVVTDPNGVLVGGRNYPQGTAVDRIPASDAHVKAWTRFGQVGKQTDEPPAASSETK